MAIGSNDVGIISIAQELGISEENISLVEIGENSSLSPPHGISEFYNGRFFTSNPWTVGPAIPHIPSFSTPASQLIGNSDEILYVNGYCASPSYRFVSNNWEAASPVPVLTFDSQLRDAAAFGPNSCNGMILYAASFWSGGDCTYIISDDTWNTCSGPIFGGNNSDFTYTYYYATSGAGSPTSALYLDNSVDYFRITHQWNGSTWSIEENVNNNFRLIFTSVVGNDTIAACISCKISASTSCLGVWDGSTWSTCPNLNNKVNYGTSMSGTSQNSIALNTNSSFSFGGYGYNEEWNGSTWSILADRFPFFSFNIYDEPGIQAGRSGGVNNVLGLNISHCPSPYGTLTCANIVCRSFNPYKLTTAVGSYTTIPNMNVKRYCITAFGTSTASIYAAGISSICGYTGCTEEWNGSTWSNISGLNSNFNYFIIPKSFGTSTNGLAFKRASPAQYWDGSTWSNKACPAFESRFSAGSSGYLGFLFGTGGSQCSNLWDGCIWSTYVGSNNSKTAYYGASGGTINSALIVDNNDSEEFDGVVWSNGGTPISGCGGGGPSELGGDAYSATYISNCDFQYNQPASNQFYNGSVWSLDETHPLISCFSRGSAAGSAGNLVLAGGESPPANSLLFETTLF